MAARTKAPQEEIEALFRGGATSREVADHYGLTTDTILARFNARGTTLGKWLAADCPEIQLPPRGSYGPRTNPRLRRQGRICTQRGEHLLESADLCGFCVAEQQELAA